MEDELRRMKEDKKIYELLDHVGDAYIAVCGDALENTFEKAAIALFDIMTDIDKIEPLNMDKFFIEAKDETELLHEWLEKLHLTFEIEGKLYSKFRINKIKTINKKKCMKAEAYGEPFNPSKHLSKVEVKAVTLHKILVENKGNRVKVKFLLDL
jgi:SHS2 domain-containing protein